MGHAGQIVPKQCLITLKWEDPDKASCVGEWDRYAIGRDSINVLSSSRRGGGTLRSDLGTPSHEHLEKRVFKTFLGRGRVTPLFLPCPRCRLNTQG